MFAQRRGAGKQNDKASFHDEYEKHPKAVVGEQLTQRHHYAARIVTESAQPEFGQQQIHKSCELDRPSTKYDGPHSFRKSLVAIDEQGDTAPNDEKLRYQQ